MKQKLLYLFIVILVCSSCDNIALPVAEFTYEIKGKTVSFMSQSQNTMKHQWYFGDGEERDDVAHPIHTYKKDGTYTVMLVAYNENMEWDSVTHSITIGDNNGGIVSGSEPTANFNYTPLQPYEQQEVTFSNTSTNATYYNWDFGNNNTSTNKNPTTRFDKGVWAVTLTAYNEDKTKRHSITKTINVQDAPIHVYISGYAVNSIDINNSNGEYWDGSLYDGPDIFIKVFEETKAIYEEPTHMQDVSQEDIPYIRATDCYLNYFYLKSYTIRLYDYDSFSDDLMATFSFSPMLYMDDYPNEVTLTSGKYSITLSLNWQN